MENCCENCKKYADLSAEMPRAIAGLIYVLEFQPEAPHSVHVTETCMRRFIQDNGRPPATPAEHYYLLNRIDNVKHVMVLGAIAQCVLGHMPPPEQLIIKLDLGLCPRILKLLTVRPQFPEIDSRLTTFSRVYTYALVCYFISLIDVHTKKIDPSSDSIFWPQFDELTSAAIRSFFEIFNEKLQHPL